MNPGDVVRLLLPARLARLGSAALAATLCSCRSPSPTPSSPSPAIPPAHLSSWRRVEWLTDRLGPSADPAEKARLENELGRAYLEVGRPARAREFFFRSLRKDPAGDLVASNERGIGEAFLREGNAPSAEPSLARAVLRSAPGAGRDEARLLQAICLSRLGRPAEAEALRRSIENPDRASLVLLERTLASTPAPEAPKEEVAKAREKGGPLAIRPRASWGPRPIGPDVDPMGVPARITIHHSATPFTQTTETETALEIRSIQRIHQNDYEWADIGYHFVVDRAGRTWEARPLRIQGAHAGNRAANRGNIGICLLGNFEQEPIPPRQAEALRALLDELRSRHRIASNRVYTHREIRSRYGLRSTECPGRTLQALVERLRPSVLARGR